ncbi:unnamed protein product [Protopolystoma xenopodis]|uniref:Uncharacterized protein n=1 Tax=Protopolystoma xenopodis TaxID=117903 RepID=A0A448XB65_9PLAT|nr:unnamed protein product [Protopolystoma xenopodis]
MVSHVIGSHCTRVVWVHCSRNECDLSVKTKSHTNQASSFCSVVLNVPPTSLSKPIQLPPTVFTRIPTLIPSMQNVGYFVDSIASLLFRLLAQSPYPSKRLADLWCSV